MELLLNDLSLLVTSWMTSSAAISTMVALFLSLTTPVIAVKMQNDA
jgi:hypothetical protein